MRRQYEGVDDIILTIDGLQPEKGHETLYVVRELTQKRVWFAEPLLSATAPEVQRLIVQAKQWAEILGKRVILWVSDKQDAFVTGIAAEFPLALASWCAGCAIKRPCESVPATLAPAVHDPDARRRVRHCVARLPVQPKPVRPEATNSFPGSYSARDRPVVVFLHPCARNP